MFLACAKRDRCFIVMRICLFTSSLNQGGAERVFVNLANHWAQLGHVVDFVVISPEGAFREALNPSVRLVDLGAQSGKLPVRLGLIKAFASYLRNAQPDQVFATLTYVIMTALWSAKMSKFKGRMVVRQANSICNQSEQTVPVRLWNWIGYRVCYRWADSILVNSANSEAEMLDMLPYLRGKIRLIHNPVRIEGELIREDQDEELPIVLASGRFAVQKDYPTLLRAFARVRSEREIRLLILGDGPLRAEIENLVEALGISESVELLGYVDDPDAYYSRASVFVLASRWEGFPNVLVEALAAGLPVVATDSLGGSRDILGPILPENIIPVGDVDLFSRRIIQTLEQQHDPQCYRDYVRKRFDLPVIAEQYLET